LDYLTSSALAFSSEEAVEGLLILGGWNVKLTIGASLFRLFVLEMLIGLAFFGANVDYRA
jgi:hypothetical protein